MDVRLSPIEYAQRDLPPVCAVTGATADCRLNLEVRRPLSPISLLLILLGPPGWLILGALILRDGEDIWVDVPLSMSVMDDVWEKRRRWRVLLRGAAAASIVFAVAVSSRIYPAAWLAFLPIIGLGIWTAVKRPHRIRLRIDEARFVTMSNVHPAFVAATEQWRSDPLPSTPQP